MRLHPGREDRDRPADRATASTTTSSSPSRSRRPTSRRSRTRSAGRSPRGASGRARTSRARTRSRASRPRPSRTRSSSPATPTATISLYTQGAFTDLCRGPHLQNSSPIKAVKLTSLAGAYWRGDEKNTQLTRIYGTAFYSQADLDAHLERLEQARARDHRRLGHAARPLPPRRPLARLAVLAPEGDGALERARGPPPPRERAARLRRGEDAAPLRHQPTSPRATTRTSARTCSSIPPTRGRDAAGLKPMNCPGHMLLFGSQLRSYRDLPDPLRGVVDAPPQRARRARSTGSSASSTSRRTTRTSSVTRGADPGRDRRHDRLRRATSTAASGSTPRAELSTRPENRLGTDEQWDHAEARARSGAEAAWPPVRRLARGGVVLRAEDRPAHDRRARPQLADGDDPARLPDAGPVRADLHGAGQPRARARRHPPRAARLARALHRDPRRALRGRLPVLARARAGPGRSRSGRATARPPARCASGSTPRATASRWTTATTRSASGSGTPSSRRCRSSSSTATASRTRRSRCVSAAASSRPCRSTTFSPDSRARRRSRPVVGRAAARTARGEAGLAPRVLLASRACKQELIASSPPGLDSRRFNRAGWRE